MCVWVYNCPPGPSKCVQPSSHRNTGALTIQVQQFSLCWDQVCLLLCLIFLTSGAENKILLASSGEKASFPPPRRHSIGTRLPLSSLYRLAMHYFSLRPPAFCGLSECLCEQLRSWGWNLGPWDFIGGCASPAWPWSFAFLQFCPITVLWFFFPDSLISSHGGLLPSDSAGGADSSGWGQVVL